MSDDKPLNCKGTDTGLGHHDYKEYDVQDLIPFGWAPGDYVNKCTDCDIESFKNICDKRAWRCKSCAIKAREEYDNREREVIKTTVDGVLEVDNTLSGRIYYFNGNQLWDPREVDKIVLKQVILHEELRIDEINREREQYYDEYFRNRSKDKDTTMQESNE